MKRRWGYPLVMVASVVALLGAGGWLAWGMRAQLAALDPAPTPVVAEVADASVDHAAKATLSGALVTQPSLLWNAAVGTVTAVRVAPGDTVVPGSAIADIDGLTIRAYFAETALHRTIAREDKGADVAVAQEVLNAVLPGTNLPLSGKFGPATENAVKSYERKLGIAEPTGVLNPAWFVLLPDDEFTVGDVALRLGQPAPGAGEAALSGAQEVTEVTVSTESDGPDGKYRFVYQGKDFDVARTGDEWRLADEAAASELLNNLSAAPEDGLLQVEGRIALATPVQGQAVPPAALVLDQQGRTCVLLAEGFRAVTVEPLGSAVDGAALIRSDLEVGEGVLVNPLQMVPGTPCP